MARPAPEQPLRARRDARADGDCGPVHRGRPGHRAADQGRRVLRVVEPDPVPNRWRERHGPDGIRYPTALPRAFVVAARPRRQRHDGARYERAGCQLRFPAEDADCALGSRGLRFDVTLLSDGKRRRHPAGAHRQAQRMGPGLDPRERPPCPAETRRRVRCGVLTGLRVPAG